MRSPYFVHGAALLRRQFALLLGLAMFGAAAAPSVAAETLVEFTEGGGCRVLGSARSIARMREVAAQGTVKWEGRCRNGFIDGPGTLRHEGMVREGDRLRRYAFYLTGTAMAGKRMGLWRRESLNMQDGAPRYWISVAMIPYKEGAASGEAREMAIAAADFTAAFRRLVAEADARLAAASGTVASRAADGKPPAATPPAASGTWTSAEAAPAPAAAAASQAPAGAVPAARAPASSAPPPAAPASPAPAATGALQRHARGAGDAHDELPVPVARLNPYGRVAMWLEQLSSGTGISREAPGSAPGCALDMVNDRQFGGGSVVVRAAETLIVAGWAADPKRAQVPARAWLVIRAQAGSGRTVVELSRNVERPDVARAMGGEAFLKSGFRVTLPPNRLAPGDYTMSIVQQFASELQECAAVARLEVR